MKPTITILAGTALALCFAGTPAVAGTMRPETADSIRYENPAGMLMLAQAEDEGVVEPQEEPRRKKRRAEAERPARADAAAGEEQPRKKRRAEARAEEPAAREPARAEEQPRKKRRAEAERPARADAAAGEEQPRKKRRAEARAEEPAAREPARAEGQPRKKRSADAERRAQADAPAAEEPARAEEQPRKKRRTDAEQQPAQAETPSAEEPARAEEQPRKKRRTDAEQQPAQAETPSAEEPTRAEEQPRKKRRTDAEQPAQAEMPSAEEPTRAEEQPRKKRRTDAEQPAQAETPSADEPARAEEQPRKRRRTDAEQPAQAETPSADEPARAEEQPRKKRRTDAEQPAQAETERPATAEPSDETVRADEQRRKKNRRPRDGGKAPILDSAKDEPADADRPAAPVEAAAPPPADDRAAQAERIDRRKIARADSERGERIDRERARERRRDRPEGSDVVRELGDRVVIQLGDQIMVEDKDRGRRIRRDARDVYYEELPRGRQREIVERRDGTRIVTIRDSYGDVIRRSRFEPDGNEIILAYVDEEAFERDDRDGRWYDPGRDLPPLLLAIPEEEYILDAEDAGDDADTYYAFLDQPPVEKIQRYYSVDEVKRSARIRDTVRRVDLDTITFGFGSADIAEGEVERLDNVAQAMEKLLKQNPAETFLIEGHTDAVGSDVANLALSDRRAEAVAQALTDVFEIPPENLETQGYGEEYLKVNVDGPERENRRVSIRRITPLVAPVASAE